MPNVFFGVDTAVVVVSGDDDLGPVLLPSVGLTKGLRVGVEVVPLERPMDVPGREGAGLEVTAGFAVAVVDGRETPVRMADAMFFLIDSSSKFCRVLTSSLTFSI